MIEVGLHYFFHKSNLVHIKAEFCRRLDPRMAPSSGWKSPGLEADKCNQPIKRRRKSRILKRYSKEAHKRSILSERFGNAGKQLEGSSRLQNKKQFIQLTNTTTLIQELEEILNTLKNNSTIHISSSKFLHIPLEPEVKTKKIHAIQSESFIGNKREQCISFVIAFEPDEYCKPGRRIQWNSHYKLIVHGGTFELDKWYTFVQNHLLTTGCKDIKSIFAELIDQQYASSSIGKHIIESLMNLRFHGGKRELDKWYTFVKNHLLTRDSKSIKYIFRQRQRKLLKCLTDVQDESSFSKGLFHMERNVKADEHLLEASVPFLKSVALLVLVPHVELDYRLCCLSDKSSMLMVIQFVHFQDIVATCDQVLAKHPDKILHIRSKYVSHLKDTTIHRLTAARFYKLEIIDDSSRPLFSRINIDLKHRLSQPDKTPCLSLFGKKVIDKITIENTLNNYTWAITKPDQMIVKDVHTLYNLKKNFQSVKEIAINNKVQHHSYNGRCLFGQKIVEKAKLRLSSIESTLMECIQANATFPKPDQIIVKDVHTLNNLKKNFQSVKEIAINNKVQHHSYNGPCLFGQKIVQKAKLQSSSIESTLMECIQANATFPKPDQIIVKDVHTMNNLKKNFHSVKAIAINNKVQRCSYRMPYPSSNNEVSKANEVSKSLGVGAQVSKGKWHTCHSFSTFPKPDHEISRT